MGGGTIHDSADCHGNVIKAESGTNELGCSYVHTDTPQHSLKVQELASTGNGVQIMSFYTNDNCDGEADVEATPANEGCININRHQYSYKVSFTPNTPPAGTAEENK